MIKLLIMPFEHLIQPISEHPVFIKKALSLKQMGQVVFAGLVGAAPAALLAVLAGRYKDILVLTPSTAKAVSLGTEFSLF
ncbi:MAG: hypothetical protein JW782_07850, partial [Candidatus Saganbacteria bacterium]|nr:hypothetical protein [Candidatus Saganbacteria bacterium]